MSQIQPDQKTYDESPIALVSVKKRRKKPRPLLIIIGALVAMMLVSGIFFFIAQITQPDLGPTPITQQDLRQITDIPVAELENVGAGQGVTPLHALASKDVRSSLSVGSNGKPLIFYHGGEYCPFCAAERWSIIIALSQFGKFSHLSRIRSSEDQIASPTFQQSSYQSAYLDFVTVERSQNPFGGDPSMSQQEKDILKIYDAPPYVSSDTEAKIPFLDIANHYLQAGASFDIQLLLNLSWQDIAHALSNSQSPITQRIIGTANAIIAATCITTHQQPATVCHRVTILHIQKTFS